MLKHCSKTRFMHQTLTRKQCSVGLDGLFRLPNAKSSLPNVSDKWLKVPCKLHLKQACFVSICAHQLLTFPNCPWCHRLFSNCFLNRLPMLLGYLHPCITKLKEKTEFKVQNTKFDHGWKEKSNGYHSQMEKKIFLPEFRRALLMLIYLNFVASNFSLSK